MARTIPRSAGERLRFLTNLASKMPNYVGIAGITAADAARVEDLRAGYAWLLQQTNRIRTFSRALTRHFEIVDRGPETEPLGDYPVAPVFPPPPAPVPAGMFRELQRLIDRTRASDGFNQAMAADLGIALAAAPQEWPEARCWAIPQMDSKVLVKWRKYGASAARIESRRGTEQNWTLLTIDLSPPYLDARPPLVPGQPEIRQYRIRLLRYDDAVGDYSPSVVVSTIP